MDRREFLKTGTVIGVATALDSVFAKGVIESGLDRLVDEKGNFVLQPLPYPTDFLEPVIDEETVYLHYTYHHGGAVKKANKDLQMIKKALKEGNLSEVDYWTKRFEYHFSSHVLHTIYWTNLTNKKIEPKGELKR